MERERRGGVSSDQAGIELISEQAFKELMRRLAGTYANRVSIDRTMLDAYWALWQHCTPNELAAALTEYAETEIGSHVFPTAAEIVRIAKRRRGEAIARNRQQTMARELNEHRQLVDRSDAAPVGLFLKALYGRLDRTLTRTDYIATLETLDRQYPDFGFGESARQLRAEYERRPEERDDPEGPGAAQDVAER